MPAPSARGHELRATRVGASEVGALMGWHPYVSRADVWARLSGHDRRKPETDAMRMGNVLESTVARLWADQQRRRVKACARTYAHDVVPLAATPDYYVPHHELLEVKVSGDRELWATLPEYVYWQVQAQLLCTGRTRCHVAALVGGVLRTFQVDAEPGDQALMGAEVLAFMRDHVSAGVPPAGADAALVLKVQPPPPGTAAADGEDEDVAVQLRKEMAAERYAHLRVEELRGALAASLQVKGARTLQGRDWTFGMDARGALVMRVNGGTK